MKFFGNFIVDGGQSFAMSAPWSIELNEYEFEFVSDSWEIFFGEDQNMIFFGVGLCEED